PDIQEMHVAGGDSWIATDGGMSFSTDFFANTAQTSARNQGLNGSDLWGFDIGWSTDIAVGGRYHNGNTCWSENYGGRFLRMGGAEAPTGYINPVENQKAYFSDLGGRILPNTFTDQAKYFPIGKWPNESYYTMESGEMTWDPICYNTVFIGSGNSFMKSTNGGGSYSTLFSSPDDGAVLEHIEVARSNPRVMYVTQRSNSTYSGKIWRTIDGGINWTAIANTPGTSNGDRRVSQITVGGGNPMEIWVAYRAAGNGKKVFYSVDGGDTWTNWSTSTIDGAVISDIVHQLGTNGGVYLGCNDGKLYYRNALMNDWTLYNEGMPASMNALLLKPFYRDKKLKYSGNMGIWEAPLFEESKLLAGPSVDRQSSYCVSDTFYFGDYSVQASGATLTWDFPGATFVSDIHSTAPKVVYSATGSYDVTLSITGGVQTNSKTVQSMVSILANECEVDSVAGKCITLSKSGDYVESPALDLETNTITWTAWIRPEGNQVSFAGLLFSGSGDACGINLMNNNQLGYHWAGSGGTYNWQGGPIVPVNQWSHIALVVTAASATVYLNGVPYTRTANHPLVLMDQPVLIGSDRGYTDRNFKGLIDEVCLYNRSLSSDEIRSLMHLTKQNVVGFPQPDVQLAAYYQFNETEGAVFNKARGGQAILHGDAVRTRSSAPVASGRSQSKLITNTGLFDLDSVGVQIQYDVVAQLPNGLVYVSRLNSLPDTLPTCTAWSYNRHYWILHNYGTEPNPSFSDIQFALPGLPDIANLPSESYQLLYRNAIADSLSWQDILPADVQLAADNISFENVGASNGNQQLFVASHLLDQQIAGPDTVCAGQMNSYAINTDPLATYEWSLDNGDLEFGFNPAIALVTLNSMPATLSCKFNADGCSTVITKQLFLYPTQTPTLTFDGEFLSMQDQYDEYLWYLDDELITDATGADWKVLQSGLYKIIVKDENGCQYETEMLVIIDKTKEQAKNWLRIYPNPGKDWIRIDGNQDLQKVTCFNSTGMKLGDLEIENHLISIGKLFAGQYFIQVKMSTGELYYGKFVKQ
ncbi:MAG: LamG-like jellyroll fold domain-containing protein, partial [Saprospiraceae bacterium]